MWESSSAGGGGGRQGVAAGGRAAGGGGGAATTTAAARVAAPSGASPQTWRQGAWESSPRAAAGSGGGDGLRGATATGTGLSAAPPQGVSVVGFAVGVGLAASATAGRALLLPPAPGDRPSFGGSADGVTGDRGGAQKLSRWASSAAGRIARSLQRLGYGLSASVAGGREALREAASPSLAFAGQATLPDRRQGRSGGPKLPVPGQMPPQLVPARPLQRVEVGTGEVATRGGGRAPHRAPGGRGDSRIQPVEKVGGAGGSQPAGGRGSTPSPENDPDMFKYLERQVEILKKALATTEAQLASERKSHSEQVAKYERAAAAARGAPGAQALARGPSEEVRAMQKRVREVEAETTITTNVLQAKLEAAQTKARELELQVRSLEESVGRSESAREEAQGDEAALQEEAEGLRAQLSQLESKLKSAQAAAEEERQQQAALREKLKGTLQGQIEAAEQAKEAGTKATALARSKKALEASVVELEAGRTGLEKELGSLQTALLKAENECVAARARESSYREELLQSATRETELQRQLKLEAEAVPREASRTIERLQGELERSADELFRLESVRKELQEQTSVNEGLVNTVKELKEAFAVTPDEERQKIERLEDELQQSREDLERRLGEQEASFRSELVAAADRQSELLQKLEEEKELVPREAMETIDRLKKELDQGQKDAVARLAERESAHRTELLDVGARLSRLQQELSAERQTVPEEAQSTIAHLQEQVAASSSLFESLDASLGDLRALHEREVRELRSLNTSLEGSLTDMEEQASESQTTEETLHAQLEDLQAELSERAREIEGLELRCCEAEDELEAAKKELEKAEELQAAVLSSTDDALDSNVNTLRATLEQTSMLLEGSQSQNDELVRQVMQLTSKVASQNKMLEEASSSASDADSLREAQATIGYLKSEILAKQAVSRVEGPGRVGVVHQVFNAIDEYLSRTGQRLVDLFGPFDSDHDGKLEEWETCELLRTVMPTASEKDIRRCTDALCYGPGRSLCYEEILQRLARSGNEGEKVRVSFRVDFLAGEGEEIRLAGSHADLGNWSVSQAPAMKVGDGDERGIWSVEVELPAGGVYEYKYVLVTKGEGITKVWQPGPNLVLPLSPRSAYSGEDPTVNVHDAWDGCPLTAPFGSTVNARATVLGTLMARVTAAELASERSTESAEAMLSLAAWFIALAGSGTEGGPARKSAPPSPMAVATERIAAQGPRLPAEEAQAAPQEEAAVTEGERRRLGVNTILSKLADLREEEDGDPRTT